ncbi:MAG: protein kinase, partial [Elusimicrobia bacterium]|nr:protein kinase [Elusimicrobiota bacterium]
PWLYPHGPPPSPETGAAGRPETGRPAGTPSPYAVQGQKAYSRAVQSAPALNPANGSHPSETPPPDDAIIGETSMLGGPGSGPAGMSAAEDPPFSGSGPGGATAGGSAAASAGGLSTFPGKTPGGAATDAGPPGAAPGAPSLLNDARTSLRIGDSKAAIALLRQAVAAHPADVEAAALLSMAYSRAHDHRAALAAADAALKLAPDSASLLDARAYALNRLGDFRGALAAADRAADLRPRDAVAQFNRVIALAGLGDRSGALDALRTAAMLSPKFAPYLEKAQKAGGEDLSFLFQSEGQSSLLALSRSLAPLPPQLPWWALGAVAGGVCALALRLLARRRRRSASAAPAAKAQRLAGRYELGRRIGEGGMGLVYEGKDLVLRKRVAIKGMRRELRADERLRRRFLDEARVVAKLRHPHIVDLVEIVEEKGEVYLVFDYVAGRTLEQWIAEGRLPFAQARALFRQAASALDYAHERGVIHRDLKPSNIMVDDKSRAWVMDFGIARVLKEAAGRGVPRRQTLGAGTPPYTAPEQEQGKACRESDVYSLAICLYEAVTGERPFFGVGAGLLMNKLKKEYAPPSAVATGLPPGLDAVFARAFEPDPQKRYPSAGALVRELDALS